jgi:hypothetical protein
MELVEYQKAVIAFKTAKARLYKPASTYAEYVAVVKESDAAYSALVAAASREEAQIARAGGGTEWSGLSPFI